MFVPILSNDEIPKPKLPRRFTVRYRKPATRALNKLPSLLHFSIALTTSALGSTIFAVLYLAAVVFRIKYYFFSSINRNFIDQLKNYVIIMLISGSETICWTLYFYRLFLNRTLLKRIWKMVFTINVVKYSTPISFKYIIVYVFVWIPFYYLIVAYMRKAGVIVYIPYGVHVLFEMKCAIINLQFCSVLFIIRVQIDALKFRLRALRKSARNIEGICYLKEWMLSLAKSVNHFYGPVMIGVHLLFLANFTSTVYLVWQAVNPPKVVLIVLRVFQATGLLSLLLFVTSSCDSVTNSAEGFNNELFKLMRESKDLCSNEKLHLYVTMKQTLNFTACGFFTIGYPLVTSIIAAATTYLVILVQFSMSSDGSSGGK